MATVQTESPSLVLKRPTGTSNTDLLERIVNRTTLSTQRATHRHILDKFQKTKKKKKTAPVCGGEQERGALPEHEEEEGSEASALCRLEEELQELRAGAERERELAMQQQKQVLEARFQEVLLNRDRLEEERLHQLSQRLRLEAVEAAQVLEERQREDERRAVQDACRALRLQLAEEAEAEKQREVRRVLAEAQAEFALRQSEAEEAVRQDCKREGALERERQEERHREELRLLAGEISGLRQQLCGVTREKMEYEKAFKEVQVNYRRFIDLTDSSLHSDYLLELRALGRPAGLSERGVQTDEISTPQTQPGATP
ncbi:plectin isoform X2 [Polyodon spathula]|uniref:plectin isoform X2 n=1 Tax=Polyodon spathula TaxID=7913 RepID=UPI001B7DEB5B|nr:plectin isoform X2 [Polyodon spathula]